MLNSSHLKIETLFETSSDQETNHYYLKILLSRLKKVLPPEFFENKETIEALHLHQKHQLHHLLPLITCSEGRVFPGNLSFFAFSKYRPDSFKFFFEMISRWLIPGKRLNVVLVYVCDFRLPDLSDDIYTMCEVMVHLDSVNEFQTLQNYFPIIGTEIELGLNSAFYAQRILEIKGLSADEKTALIQGSMAFLIKRFPYAYNDDVFIEMQHVLVVCRDEFKEMRQARHLSRIISVKYLFRKSLRELVKKNPHKRYLSLKLFKVFIQTPQGRRRVLAVLVGVNLFREREAFEEKHLLRAIQHYIPSVQAIDKSFFINKLAAEDICTLYLEVEKKDGADFTMAEIRRLRKELPINLKNRIEHRQHPIFMPRNEEEVMRNILALSNQIKFLRDIPQVFISFDEQAPSHLSFTVILVRVLKFDSRTLADIFKKGNTCLEYIHDRTKIVGHIRKRHPKEATVFRLKLPKENFLRADHSIDLYKARQTVAAELTRLFGDIRDYNGGMISKQHELLSDIRRLLADIKDYDELLLENFFYSLAPVVVRALLDPKAFKTLFLMLLEGLKEFHQEGYYYKFHQEPYNTFVIVISEDVRTKELLHQAIQGLHIPSTELAHAYTKANNQMCIGYICCVKDVEKKEQFFETIRHVLENTATLSVNG